MAKTGRPRKPTVLKVIEGTARKDRQLPAEPKPQLAIPPCPCWLDAEAKREWRRVSKELHSLGLLTRVDRAALAAYCQCYARWRKAEEMVRADGLVITTTQLNIIQHPAVGIANKALAEMRAFLTEFGMTPAARTRIHAKPLEGDKDAAKAFLFGPRSVAK